MKMKNEEDEELKIKKEIENDLKLLYKNNKIKENKEQLSKQNILENKIKSKNNKNNNNK
jgi:hypothetical protein